MMWCIDGDILDIFVCSSISILDTFRKRVYEARHHLVPTSISDCTVLWKQLLMKHCRATLLLRWLKKQNKNTSKGQSKKKSISSLCQLRTTVPVHLSLYGTAVAEELVPILIVCFRKKENCLGYWVLTLMLRRAYNEKSCRCRFLTSLSMQHNQSYTF